MVKKWIDAGEITTRELPCNSKYFAVMMQEVPNFNKREGASKIYEKEGYIILKMKRGFIAYNSKKEFSKGHTHLYNFNMAKTVIDNCIKKKRPKTDSLYILDSHLRLSKDEDYKLFINEIIDAKKGSKKLKCINVNKER